MDKKTTAGHIMALITIVIWGTTFISTKILLADFTPIEILFFRFLLGLLVLIVIYPKRLNIKDKKQEFIFPAYTKNQQLWTEYDWDDKEDLYLRNTFHASVSLCF